MAQRGYAPVYLKYSGAAQTHRLSGGDKMNWQNNQRGGKIRDAIYAPLGKVLVVADSANIEARVDDWLAMQEDALKVYRDYDAGDGPDVYCVMASKIYERTITPADKAERQFGKVVKLACGYQMGAERLRETARQFGVHISMQQAVSAIDIYRASHGMVKLLWNRAQTAIPALLSGPDGDKYLDPRNLIEIRQGALVLPNGLLIRYPDLQRVSGSSFGFGEWTFRSQRGERTNLYGGKVVENIVQALARIIVLEQTLAIAKHAPVKLSVHDEGVFLVEEERAEEVKQIALDIMSRPLSWCPDLPLAAKVNIAVRYGDAK
jgi:DNA polymerase